MAHDTNYAKVVGNIVLVDLEYVDDKSLIQWYSQCASESRSFTQKVFVMGNGGS